MHGRRKFLNLLALGGLALVTACQHSPLPAPPAPGTTAIIAAGVTTWPRPLNERPFSLCTLSVNGVVVPVWTARVRQAVVQPEGCGWTHAYQGPAEEAGFARFDFAGTAEIEILVGRDFRQAEILPRAAGIVPAVEGRRLRFRLQEPRPLTLLLDGRDTQALHLFARRPETDVPSPGDPNVVYFGPGEHWVSTIRLTSGQTLYLDGGAVLRAVLPAGTQGRDGGRLPGLTSYPGAVILADGAHDIRIRGRGIIDASLLPHPGYSCIALNASQRLRLEGLTLRDAAGWNVVIQDCDKVTVEQVTGISGRLNSDGINTVSSRQVRVRDCFMRTHDDTYAVKTMLPGRPAEEIRYDRCVAWNDWGFALGVTYETRARIRDLRFTDCDVVFARNWAIGVHAADSATVSDVLFDGVAVEYPATTLAPMLGCALVRIDNHPDMWTSDPEVGRVSRIVLRRVSARGRDVPPVQLEGADASHPLADLRFEAVTINGHPLDPTDSAQLQANPHVRGLAVVAP